MARKRAGRGRPRSRGLEVRRGVGGRRRRHPPRRRSRLAATAGRSSSWSRRSAASPTCCSTARGAPRAAMPAAGAAAAASPEAPPRDRRWRSARGAAPSARPGRRAAREYERPDARAHGAARLSARASDRLVSRGERLASALVAAVMRGGTARARAGSTRPTFVVDRRPPRRRHAGPGDDAARGRGACCGPLLRAAWFRSCPGFIGAAPDGSVTTLGRGGSDLTATLLGRCARRARASCCGRTCRASSRPIRAPCPTRA